MKEIIKTIAAVSMIALLASCQMNTADDGNQNETQPSVNTTEYTVSFDLNFPEDTDEVIYCDITDNTAPSSMKANEGQNITLPSCATEMTRYPRNSTARTELVMSLINGIPVQTEVELPMQQVLHSE